MLILPLVAVDELWGVVFEGVGVACKDEVEAWLALEVLALVVGGAWSRDSGGEEEDNVGTILVRLLSLDYEWE